ncbi:peptide-methionine (S)-S-oxide reductase MsrA [Roseibium hamelinense]|nr:peptide-methionine (S)-S-oxide reductase MsrA [Roseibium hamelinense]
MTMLSKKFELPSEAEALPGRREAVQPEHAHAVFGQSLLPPYPDDHDQLIVGMGSFWASEPLFWDLGGVHVTAVGYAGGFTPNPTHNEVQTGRTGHAECIKLVFDRKMVPLSSLLKIFFENHDPTQGMQQGHLQGTQYRSLLVVEPGDAEEAKDCLNAYSEALQSAGATKAITTQILTGMPFYFAEQRHQQFAAKASTPPARAKGLGIQMT